MLDKQGTLDILQLGKTCNFIYLLEVKKCCKNVSQMIEHILKGFIAKETRAT